MATKFSPCKGSYVLNQFPSNVMFGMNGFHVSASGAIQGHHGPLVDNHQQIKFGSLRVKIIRLYFQPLKEVLFLYYKNNSNFWSTFFTFANFFHYCTYLRQGYQWKRYQHRQTGHSRTISL